MGHLLTDTDRQSLFRLRPQEKNTKHFVRLSALLMMDAGRTYEDIELALGVSATTLTRWRKVYVQEGWHAVLEDRYKAYTGKLSVVQCHQVAGYVASRPVHSAQQVADWIAGQWDIKYTVSSVTYLLHRLGFTYKKVKTVGHRADPDKQGAFLERFWQLAGILPEDACIYFLDGVHPTHNVTPHYQWVKKGEQKVVAANTGRRRVNLNGAVNANRPQEVIIHECERVNAGSTVALCKKIREHRPKGLKVIINDNAGYYRSRAFQEWIEDQDDFIQVFLPAYSPNLNIIERLWKWMKKQVCRRFYAKFSDFRRALLDFFEGLSQQGDQLRRLLTLQFELLPTPVVNK